MVNIQDRLLELDGWEQFDNNHESKKVSTEDRIDVASDIYYVFSTPLGKKLLDKWIQDFIMKPIANPRDDSITIGIREGQARFVRLIMQQIEIAKKG